MAGDITTLTLEWSDPDRLPGATASVRVDTGDAGLVLAPLASTSVACPSGHGACGSLSVPIRFARNSESSTVSATISIDGEAPITVNSAPSAIRPPASGRTVVVRVPEGVDPESGKWTFMPTAGDPMVRDYGDGTGVSQRYGNLPATVLVLPAGQGGTLAHEHAGCRAEVAVDNVDGIAETGLFLAGCAG